MTSFGKVLTHYFRLSWYPIHYLSAAPDVRWAFWGPGALAFPLRLPYRKERERRTTGLGEAAFPPARQFKSSACQCPRSRKLGFRSWFRRFGTRKDVINGATMARVANIQRFTLRSESPGFFLGQVRITQDEYRRQALCGWPRGRVVPPLRVFRWVFEETQKVPQLSVVSLDLINSWNVLRRNSPLGTLSRFLRDSQKSVLHRAFLSGGIKSASLPFYTHRCCIRPSSP